MEELNYKEQAWILHYDSTNRNKGYNLMTGGGNSRHSEETKQILREKSKRNWLDPIFREHIVERITKAHRKQVARDKMSEILSKQWSDEKYRSKTLSAMRTDEYRKKQSDSHKRILADKDRYQQFVARCKKYNGVKVMQVESGQIYETIKDAAKSVGVSDTSIYKVLHGKRKTAGGLHWRHEYQDE
jgi:hypothetical protein